ncbi:MAG: hypothetical protein EpisKO_41630 [Epibacterium sp.]
MAEATQDQYEAAKAALTAEDFTANGLPKMKPLNAALASAGLEPLTAEARDAFEEAGATGDEQNDGDEEISGEDAPSGKVELTILDAPANPVPLHVHGVGNFSLRIGEPQMVPREALDALHNAGGITFTHEDM